MPNGKRINPAIAPGGFAEACFAGSNLEPDVEYLYIKDRMGFLKALADLDISRSGFSFCHLTGMGGCPQAVCVWGEGRAVT